MNTLAPVTLTYREMLLLIRCGLDFLPDIVEQIHDNFGDAAPMYKATFSLDEKGNTHVRVVPQTTH